MSKNKPDLNARPQSAVPNWAGFVGIDVAKRTVTIFDASTGRCWSVANTAQALREALEPLAG